jgi:hypothetical protein
MATTTQNVTIATALANAIAALEGTDAVTSEEMSKLHGHLATLKKQAERKAQPTKEQLKTANYGRALAAIMGDTPLKAFTRKELAAIVAGSADFDMAVCSTQKVGAMLNSAIKEGLVSRHMSDKGEVTYTAC